ncbi:MAG: T9SS type A sorting domain-containing protein [Chlorobi bacterium]|nr:T9SS type A sorting domain-containing protein [Chlorobiota bacterium]
MLKRKQKVIAFVFGIFLFAGEILPITVFAQEFEDSPFGFHPAGVHQPGYANNGLSDAQNIGVRWHRPPIYAFWFIVQPDTGDTTLDFSMYDQIYGTVPTSINILANIAPQGHIDEGYCKPGSYLPIDSAKYVRFVKATVERYDGDGIDDMPGLVNPIKYWQVGNEPLATTPSGFAQLQRITYQAIKDACPECKVLIGGTLQPMTSSGFTVDAKEYLNWFSIFYEPILTELNGNYVNIFDLHWYGNATGDYRYCGAVLDSLKTILSEYNFGEIPIWITEMGSYSGDPNGPAFSYQSERQQAGDYLKRFVFPLSVGIKKVFPAFGLMEGFIDDDSYFDHTGLIYNGEGSNDLGLGVKKLAYFSYKLMTSKLEGSIWNNILTLIDGTDNVYAYKFKKAESGEPVYVAWRDCFDDSIYTTGDSSLITLTGISSNQVMVTNAVPNDTSGIYITNFNTAFSIDTLTVSGGSVSFYLKEVPVFIEDYNATSVSEINLTGENIRIYPNPAKGIFTIEGTMIQKIELINIGGQIIKQMLIKDEPLIIDLSQQPKGIYFVKVTVDKGVVTKKIVVK